MSRWSGRGAVALATLLVGAVMAPAAHASQSYEQVDRADGVAGSAPLYGGTTRDPVITGDGRTAIFEWSSSDPSWSATAGIWRRDLDTNKTTPIVTDPSASITGFTDDDSTLSFITTQKLVSADTNTLPDLYAYSLATKTITLVSRADGASGAATGLYAPYGVAPTGFITRDGKSALFAAPSGVERRNLATGQTTAIGTSGPGYPTVGANPLYTPLSDASASADGSVFVSGLSINTPAGSITFPVATAPFGRTAVSEDGALVGYQPASSDGTPDTSGLEVVSTTTGTGRRVDLSAAAPNGYIFVGFSAGDASALLWKAVPGAPFALESVNLTSGAVTSLGFQVGIGAPVVSHNLHYAIANGLVTAAPGYPIPGGVDLPSANQYVTGFTLGCPIGFGASPVTLGLSFYDYGTPVKSFTVTVRNWLGILVQNVTLTQTGSVVIKTGGSTFKVTVTTNYADGRATVDNWNLPAQPSSCPGGI